MKTPTSKEVVNYRTVILTGVHNLKDKNLNPIRIRDLIELHAIVEPGTGDIRKIPGTLIENSRTGETVWTPPQNHEEILRLFSDLEALINDDSLQGQYPLIKMALIHFQFESIHSFTDRNGRTERIMNILYLVQSDWSVLRKWNGKSCPKQMVILIAGGMRSGKAFLKNRNNSEYIQKGCNK